jgi:putative ABC transport system permease protein
VLRLAWRNLIADKTRFVVTVVGIAFAVFLMIFQGSLLVGFVRAASRLITAANGHIWIAARGVASVDFVAPLPERFRELALGVEGVARADRVVLGFSTWKPPSGRVKTVVIVGADPGTRSEFPQPRVRSHAAGLMHESIVVDASNAADLEVASAPTEVELGAHMRRGVVREITTGFGTFLGSPYVFTAYDDAIRYLAWPSEYTGFVVVTLLRGADGAVVLRALEQRFPDADVWTAADFARQSAVYWLVKTGAGGALLTAALLGFLVGLVVVSQNMYAITVERIEEFATLQALGAGRRYIAGVVTLQAFISGVLGTAVGLALSFPAIDAATALIAWVFTPPWLLAVVTGIGVGMALLASLVAIRPLMAIEPARVFRA